MRSFVKLNYQEIGKKTYLDSTKPNEYGSKFQLLKQTPYVEELRINSHRNVDHSY